jgi:hypothetical protein
VTKRRSPSAHNAIARFWCDTYEQHTGAKYPFNGGKDGAAIKWLLSIYSEDEVRTFITGFFEIEDDFIEQTGRSMGVFRGCLPKIIQFVKKGQQQPASKVPANLHGIQEWMRKRAAGE